ncbi:C6 finger domain protein [Colletotrichum asianum]|uniref:C6 finger domain protein n=1 Tax=Colletotrichum asianum TaxID=702518 RepID=A0A8H3WGT1_9PEZI|nr:C6 finger domain protein [Colletotrichum asianum]
MQDAFFASNSCRTCRQKRVKCDRRLPACLRCSSLKLRCEGYERPKRLVWTHSMASRGKLMGKATFTPVDGSLSGVSWRSPDEDELMESGSETGPSSSAIPWSLVEPDMQDLSPECRKYIRYFDLDLSRESVVYDRPSTNPFLALMPLISKSRAFLHAVISISAFHCTHRMVISHGQMPSGSLLSHKSENPGPWYLWQDHSWQMGQPSFRESLQTALLHKQNALHWLKQEVKDDPTSNSDAVVAAVILFVCMDVVEFGSHGWNHHLRGAQEMVQSRRSSDISEDNEAAPWLRYFDTACTTFGILGATLAPALNPPTNQYPTLDPFFLQNLRNSENQTWVGCPAELLYVLSGINSMRSLHHMNVERRQALSDLVQALLNFSPLSWAQDFPDIQYHESRSHLAHAYKAGVEVYASHIIGAPPGQHYLSYPHVVEILRPAMLHLLAVPAEDFHIKSLVWPAFILGAEAQDIELRTMARTVFQRIWVSSCCYNVKNAAEILERIWAREAGDESSSSWLKYVWQLEETWLFV